MNVWIVNIATIRLRRTENFIPGESSIKNIVDIVGLILYIKRPDKNVGL